MRTTSSSVADAHINPWGMSAWTCALFIIGEMAGGGIVAMPSALMRSGWGGICLLLIGAIASWYTGVQLGQCWVMLQNAWPDFYREKTRKPYPEIGFRALEPVNPRLARAFKVLISVCIDLTLFGAACVYVLLASENIGDLVTEYNKGSDISFCFLLIIICVALLPFTFLATPVDFWPVSVGAMGTSTLAVILIVIGSLIDRHHAPTTPKYTNPTFATFATAYATITFAYGGHSAFPTLQHDMRKPAEFAKAVAIAYFAIILLYFPDAIVGYYAYGSDTKGSIIGNIGTQGLQTAVTLCITIHVLFSILVLLNVFNQDLEELFRVPHKFGVWRVLMRTIVMASVLFLSESIPQFGILLDLIGGTTVTLMTFVFPGICHILLRRQSYNNAFGSKKRERSSSTDPIYTVEEDRSANVMNGAELSTPTQCDAASPIKVWEYALNGFIVVTGILAGLASLYGTLDGLVSGDSKFTVPCYINMTAAKG